jgi:hypothetical protein
MRDPAAAPDVNHCPCGALLHYPTPEDEAWMRRLVRQRGWWITVQLGEGDEAPRYRVPRHYLALHQPTAHDLPALAACYGWERLLAWAAVALLLS